MKTIIWVCIATFIVLLSACAFKSREFKCCKMACIGQQHISQIICRNVCVQCTHYAKQTAKYAYHHYVYEQIVKGDFITRNLNSYRDPLQCRKTTCSCAADYDVCIQACGGIIQKQLTVPGTC